MNKQLINLPKVAWWRDEKIRGILYQVLLLVGIVFVFSFLASNLTANLDKQGVQTGFDFLWTQTAGFDISYTPFVDFSPDDTHATVLLIGIINTLIIGFTGVILATILGFVIGVGRLSHNWVLARVCSWYVELFRNIPLLVQIFFWYNAIILAFLPTSKLSFSLFDAFFLNGRGAYMPEPIPGESFIFVSLSIFLALCINVFIKRWAVKRQENTGETFPVFLTTLVIFIGLPTLVFLLLGSPMTFVYPELQRFGFVNGIVIIPEFMALLIALSTYTAAFIAEIVRSGIQSVSKGQTEAYRALGLREGNGMRLVIIPQALRVIIPQLTNQYLNLIKNSSLATAIGYPEIASIFMGTSMSNTQRTVEIMLITMTVYLIISLATSIFMNWYNNKMSLVER
ncbi:MAG: general L-amino acid transport system permease protein [Candidatus Endobugula sp.]|jgi:general L-amino acid transport system permease protein